MSNKLTLNIKRATDVLLIENPVGTSMGIFAGIILYGLIGLFSPMLQTITIIKISAIKWYHLVAMGIFGFNAKSFFVKTKYPIEVERRIELIEEMQNKGKITQSQADIMYHSLIKKYIESVHFDEELKADMDKWNRILGSK